MVTAKHNVDPADGITFLSFSEPDGIKYEALAKEWVLHPNLDIAIMPVECSKLPKPIFPVGSPTVLTRTITLGYPRIATTDSPYVLAHGGELNAVVNTYHGEDRLIISNVVAPGNSGGPVLDEAGLCLGIVVNAFETENEGDIERANSAIPAKHILDFIAPYCT
ncbi:MAG: serine protease [Roseibium sp.]